MSGAEQTVVTDLDEPIREHVLEEAANELGGSDGATLELVSGRFFVRESDLAIMELAEAVVADGHAKDVSGEILEGCLALADRLAVNYPPLFPYAPVHCGEKAGVFQLITQLGAEDYGQRFFRYQKVWACRLPVSVSREAAAGDQRVNANRIGLTQCYSSDCRCRFDPLLSFLAREF